MPRKLTEDEAARAFGRRAPSTADRAAEGFPKAEDRHFDVPHARDAETQEQLAKKKAQAASHQEDLLDEALEETFPSSDPISPKHVT